MHILIIPSEHFITSWSPLGGVFQLDLARALRRQGVQVGVISVGKFPGFKLVRGAQYAKREFIKEIPVFRRYIEFPLPYRFDSLLLLGRLYSEFANDLYDCYVSEFGRPDLIHAHNFRYAGCVAAKLSHRKGIPFVVTEHSSAYSSGDIRGKTAKRLAAVAALASGVSAVSAPFAEILCRALKLDRAGVNVIPNFLPEEFLSPPVWSPAPSVTEEFVFLNVAELTPIKNQRLLLEAFAANFKKTTARLRIVGDGPCKSELFSLAEHLGVSGQVEMLGRLSRAGVCDQMREADCFVFSSDSETFGVVLIEALSQGLPLVSTSCGGPSDIVNERNGLLAVPGDVKSLSAAMDEMRNHRNRFVSPAIARECHEHYGEDSVVKRYIRFYQDAVHGCVNWEMPAR